METLNVQTFGETEKYIIGKYDIEVLCLPRMIIRDVEVKQSHTATVEIPLPGIAVIIKSVNGYGSLFWENDNKLEWIYNLEDSPQQESLILQPGRYRGEFRSKFTNKSIYTIERIFDIESGKTSRINLFK